MSIVDKIKHYHRNKPDTHIEQKKVREELQKELENDINSFNTYSETVIDDADTFRMIMDIDTQSEGSTSENVQLLTQALPLLEAAEKARRYEQLADQVLSRTNISRDYANDELTKPFKDSFDAVGTIVSKPTDVIDYLSRHLDSEMWSKIIHSEAMEVIANKQSVDKKIVSDLLEKNYFQDKVIDSHRYSIDAVLDFNNEQLYPTIILELYNRLLDTNYEDLAENRKELIDKFHNRVTNLEFDDFNSSEQRVLGILANSNDIPKFIETMNSERGSEAVDEILQMLFRRADQSYQKFVKNFLNSLPQGVDQFPQFFSEQIQKDRNEINHGVIISKISHDKTGDSIVWMLENHPQWFEDDQRHLEALFSGLAESGDSLPKNTKEHIYDILLDNPELTLQANPYQLDDAIDQLTTERQVSAVNQLTQAALQTGEVSMPSMRTIFDFISRNFEKITEDTLTEVITNIRNNPVTAFLAASQGAAEANLLVDLVGKLDERQKKIVINEVLEKTTTETENQKHILRVAAAFLSDLESRVLEDVIAYCNDNIMVVISDEDRVIEFGKLYRESRSDTAKEVRDKVLEKGLQREPKLFKSLYDEFKRSETDNQLKKEDTFPFAPEQIEIMQVMERIWGSSSSQMKHLGVELAQQIVRSVEGFQPGQVKSEYEKIENIFVKKQSSVCW